MPVKAGPDPLSERRTRESPHLADRRSSQARAEFARNQSGQDDGEEPAGHVSTLQRYVSGPWVRSQQFF